MILHVLHMKWAWNFTLRFVRVTLAMSNLILAFSLLPTTLNQTFVFRDVHVSFHYCEESGSTEHSFLNQLKWASKVDDILSWHCPKFNRVHRKLQFWFARVIHGMSTAGFFSCFCFTSTPRSSIGNSSHYGKIVWTHAKKMPGLRIAWYPAVFRDCTVSHTTVHRTKQVFFWVPSTKIALLFHPINSKRFSE